MFLSAEYHLLVLLEYHLLVLLEYHLLTIQESVMSHIYKLGLLGLCFLVLNTTC